MKKFFAFVLAFALMTGCGVRETADSDISAPGAADDITAAEQPAADQTPQTPEEPELENITLRFTAVGDNLIHNTLSIDSRIDGGYDFSHIYAGVADRIEGSDIAFINQEVPLDGTEGAYPTLSAPREVAAAIHDIGFNVASLANNHMADKGTGGLISTVEALKNAGFEGIVGGYADKETAAQPVIIEKNGVRFGFLAYTYGLNSGLGGGNDWMIDRIGREKIQADVEAIRPLCDFLAVSMHWGTEYQKTASDPQREYAELLASLDVDLIIGTHSHVLQPAEWIDRDGKEQTLCVYSLGNFVSGQREEDRLLGGILELELEFTADGQFVGYKSADIEGVVTHYNYGNKGFALYMLDDYTEELAAAHGLHKYDLPITLGYFTDRMTGIRESIKR